MANSHHYTDFEHLDAKPMPIDTKKLEWANSMIEPSRVILLATTNIRKPIGFGIRNPSAYSNPKMLFSSNKKILGRESSFEITSKR
jgi:hypothetical protein